MPKLPVIQQVGVIPLQWEGPQTNASLVDVRQILAKRLPEIVRKSRRFRILNDDLIASMWKDPKDRQELRSQFELDAFVSLTAAMRGDTTTLVARLMNPRLKSLLIESEVVKTFWLQHAAPEKIDDRLESLIFRLFNRIPVDVSVTSIQGGYITLSGGKEQGIEAGDKVDLVRAKIESLHPANGTWLTFKSFPIGHAEVVEAKKHTSVAKLVRLTHEGALEVGDGAKISAIAGRVKFARMKKRKEFRDAADQRTIIVPPLYHDTPPKPKKGVGRGPNKVGGPQMPEGTTPPPAEGSEEAEAGTGKPDEPAPPPQSSDSDWSLWEEFDFEKLTEKIIDDATLSAGPKIWTMKGPPGAVASGQFPFWIVNNVAFSVTRTLLYKIKAGFGGGIGFGGTNNGSYFSYDSHARLYWQDETYLASGLISWWKVGGHGKFSGLSITDERLGGGDWIRGGGFGGVGGVIDLSGRLDWFTEFILMPLNIGRLGYNENFHQVESTFAWEWSLGAFQHAVPGEVQLGAAISLFDEKFTLSNNRRPHLQEYSLQVLGKYTF